MLGTSQGLERVTANVEEILAKLQEHAKQHDRDYAEAYKAYRQKARLMLEERMECLIHSDHTTLPTDLRFGLEPPDDHRMDYERAIGMLTLHRNAGEKTIRITPELYAAYCQDIWEWKERFWAKNVSYGMTRSVR
jgi:hypothetical protein